jgi:hypothetical protein
MSPKIGHREMSFLGELEPKAWMVVITVATE